MARAERLALALLAAGRSTRFGAADKLIADLHGRPLIEWAARAGAAIGAERLFVVAPSDPPFDLAPLGYETLVNAARDEGLSASLRLAATAAQAAGAGALIILLADMPLVTPAHLARLLAAHAAQPSRPIFSATPDGPPQPPALFPADAFLALAAMTGDKGARALAGGAAIVRADPLLLGDVDSVVDFDRIRSAAAPD